MKHEFNDYLWINQFEKFGKSVIIKKNYLRIGFIIFCMLTPCTNWMIPIVKKLIKKDLIYRYE
jgi:hypothetical protein